MPNVSFWTNKIDVYIAIGLQKGGGPQPKLIKKGWEPLNQE
jgi:hypothetical protein